MFDPTQSAHAAQQILQANQLYTTTVKTSQNVIGAYNLAQRMSMAPSTLYLRLSRTWGASIGFRSRSPQIPTATRSRGSTQSLPATAPPQPTRRQASRAQARFWIQLRLSPQGQQAIAAQGATVDLVDAVNASNLQTLGTIRANSAQREADISQLEAAAIPLIRHNIPRWRLSSASIRRS